MQQIVLLLVTFACVAVSSPLLTALGLRTGLTVRDDERHKYPVPAIGGPAIIASILLGLYLDRDLPTWIFVGAPALCIIGMLDDMLELAPAQKLTAQAVVISIVLGISNLSLTGHRIVDLGIALIWLLTTTNAFNLIDGLDGLAAGVGFIAATGIALSSAISHQPNLMFQGSVISAALASFLIYNSVPATVFMGDSGSLPLGFLLGGLAYEAGRPTSHLDIVRSCVPLFLLFIPLFDVTLVTITRLLSERRVSARDHTHCHDLLLQQGVTEFRADVLIWIVAATAAGLSIIIPLLSAQYLLVVIPFALCAAGLLFVFLLDLSLEEAVPRPAHARSSGLSRVIFDLTYKPRLAEFSLDLVMAAAAYCAAFALSSESQVDVESMHRLIMSLPWVLVAVAVAGGVCNVHRSIWRFTSLSDVGRLAASAALAAALITAIAMFVAVRLPVAATVIFAFLLCDSLMLSRFSLRAFHQGLSLMTTPSSRALIVGASDDGMSAAHYMSLVRHQRVSVMGFIDQDPFKLGKVIVGHPVIGSIEDLDGLYRARPFDQLLVVRDQLTEEQIVRVLAMGHRNHVLVSLFDLSLRELDQGKDRKESKQTGFLDVVPLAAP